MDSMSLFLTLSSMVMVHFNGYSLLRGADYGA